MNDQKRVFAAIDISDEARQRIAAYVDDLKRKMGNNAVKFESIDKLHITLKFLGDIDTNTLNRLTSAVRFIAGRYSPFTLEVAGTGVFPNAAKPRILWLGINAEELSSIVNDINNACEPLGFEPDKRDYQPHLTIGRIRDGQRSAETVKYHLDHQFAPARSTVSQLSVYESQLLRTGSVYTLVSSHGLAD